jgi:hypothetical protein
MCSIGWVGGSGRIGTSHSLDYQGYYISSYKYDDI